MYFQGNLNYWISCSLTLIYQTRTAQRKTIISKHLFDWKAIVLGVIFLLEITLYEGIDCLPFFCSLCNLVNVVKITVNRNYIHIYSAYNS